MKNCFAEVIDFWKKSNEPSIQASAYREVSRFCLSMVLKIDDEELVADKAYISKLYDNILCVNENTNMNDLVERKLRIAGDIVGGDFVDMSIFMRALECASYLANIIPDDVLIEEQHERFADEVMDLDKARTPSA